VQNLVHIPRAELLQLELALTREWLETDGCGGYASSSVLLCNRRRYHGLLVSQGEGLDRRHLFLSRFEETLHGGGRSFPLSMARYPGLFAPHGHQYLEHFELVPYPSFLYRIGPAVVLREILLVRGSPTVLSRYRVSGGGPVELRLRPLLPYRAADALTSENLALDPRVERAQHGGIRARPYPALPPISITLSSRDGHFEADPVWYRQIEYGLDLERGYDGHEDQFSPGVHFVPMRDGVDCVVAATIGEAVADPQSLWERESAARRQALPPRADTVRDRLELGVEHFLYRAAHGRLGVVAGFPWFGEWGRDTFVSLPGLLLSRGKLAECGAALAGALPYLRRGLLPNIFGASPADSHYGSADASLWYARAVRAFHLAGGDRGLLLDRLAPALATIAEEYQAGTELEIFCDDKGLLHAGSEQSNATWMDARTSAGPVTPRHGCAVEINALWYFLLAYLELLARERGDGRAEREWKKRARLCGRSFLRRFWLEGERYLADVWRPDAAAPGGHGFLDVSLRPNMVIAAALELSPLSRLKRTDVVRHARAELLTPRGLRTLAPFDAAYRGVFRGSPQERDGAYHQGTVWPWLLGFYCEAYLRGYGASAYRVGVLRDLIEGFREPLSSQGLGHISEVFDGDPPHRPGGTFAQAWNTAELLRALELLGSAEEVAP
jgi:predicted glycogen debranching enzyme